MDGDETGNRNIETCCSISGRGSCGAYLGHCQCECQGEVASGFVRFKGTWHLSAFFVPGTLSTPCTLAHLILTAAAGGRWYILPFCRYRN